MTLIDVGSGSPRAWSWDDWRHQALRAASGLRRRGVQPGDRVAMALENTLEACACLLGTWLCGATIVSLPTQPRGIAAGHHAGYVKQILDETEPSLVLQSQPMLGGVARRTATFADLLGEDLIGDHVPLAAGDPAFVQYSSGTTGKPKGCVLSAGQIAAQLERLAETQDLAGEAETIMSWLPLSHDMGLFGCVLLAYWTGATAVLSCPARFVTSPATWMGDCLRWSATLTVGPNFALEMAARAAAALPRKRLALQRLVVGGERVHAATLQRAVAALESRGLHWETLRPAYGMAESVLAVSITPPTGPIVRRLDAEALAHGAVVDATEAEHPGNVEHVVAGGVPLRDFTVRAQGDGVGELLVGGPSLSHAYWANPEETARRFRGGEFATRDLGFVGDGAVFPMDRLDDMISVAGRKVFVGAAEHAAGSISGVRAGNVAIVQVRTDSARPAIVGLVETAGRAVDRRRIVAAMAAVLRERAGIRLDECFFVDRGTLPKTPSGKLRRFQCRQLARKVMAER